MHLLMRLGQPLGRCSSSSSTWDLDSSSSTWAGAEQLQTSHWEPVQLGGLRACWF